MDRESGILLAADPTPQDGRSAPPAVAEDVGPVAASVGRSFVPPVAGAERLYKIPESGRRFDYAAHFLRGWYARSDFARDIGDEPEDSRTIACPSMDQAQSGRPSPSIPDRCHQRSPEQWHRSQQGEIDQSHLLMKRHKADVPKIRNPHGRLAEDLRGVHVDDEDTQKEYRRPSDNVAERSFRPKILP